MTEGMVGQGGEGHEAPEAGGMPVQAAPAATKFFMLEYLDEVQRGLRWLRTTPKPEEGVLKKVAAGLRKWAKGRKARIGAVAIALIVAASYSLFAAQAGQTPTYEGPGGGGPGPGPNNYTFELSGAVDENGQTEKPVTANSTNIASMTATLTWTDEVYGRLLTNQPDSMGLEVRAPDGRVWNTSMSSNPVGGQGRVVWELDAPGNFGAANWTFVVKGGTMGDCARPTGLACFLQPADTSNQFELMVAHSW
jgi:hypothetical protein